MLLSTAATHTQLPLAALTRRSMTSPGWVSFAEYVSETWTQTQQKTRELDQTLQTHPPTHPPSLPSEKSRSSPAKLGPWLCCPDEEKDGRLNDGN